MESVFYDLNKINMEINEMIEKWEKKHSSLLEEYNRTQRMMTEREICECRAHMKNVLEFVEDLRQVKNCSIPAVVGQSKQLFCDCSQGKGVDIDEDGFPYCIDCQKNVAK
jgi:adenylosuccinate synthase